MQSWGRFGLVTARGFVDHVGIYEGGGSFFHAPHTGAVLGSNSLSEPFDAARFAGGRRISG
jgi:cell wall-associated NlpC family hydrolase